MLGTGHGVGAALNVHEGPHSISKNMNNTTPLRENMIVSIEPGYYETDCYGVRIENLVRVVKKTFEEQHQHQQSPLQSRRQARTQSPFLSFEPLTFVPFQRKLIDESLLSLKEIDWFNSYHDRVFNKVFSSLRSDLARRWLLENCKPIGSKTREFEVGSPDDWEPNVGM